MHRDKYGAWHSVGKTYSTFHRRAISKMLKRHVIIVWLLTSVFLGVTPASAAEPNDVALKISGLIGKTNSKDKGYFGYTLAQIKSMPNITITATTQYTGTATFTGPKLKDILKLVELKPGAKEVIAIGLDEYRVAIPLTDFDKYEAIAAYRQNGKDLTLETKGPLWIMYPLDKYKKQFEDGVVNNRLVWSLVELHVQ